MPKVTGGSETERIWSGELGGLAAVARGPMATKWSQNGYMQRQTTDGRSADLYSRIGSGPGIRTLNLAVNSRLLYR